MRISEAWLRESIDPPVDSATLVRQLTMAGLEVDGMEAAAGDFQGVVVGEVVSIEPHPDAERLKVCRVSVAAAEPLQIVCGASNVRAAMRVPTARIGAVLPGGLEIKQAELRGVLSAGMLCSEKELGLSDSAEGLMSLPQDAPLGVDLRDYLKLDDSIIEIDLTPNRADCLSIEGIAREIAVINRIDRSHPALNAMRVDHPGQVAVVVEAPDLCPRYLGRLITGVDPGAKTPLWMRERLRRAGLRSLGPLIDVTNYVLLELGQPLHAFDADIVQGSIRVRRARRGERLLLLNDEEVELSEATLIIADDSKPLALAGIMGGRASAVSATTVNIFLECAYFSPHAILGRAREYGLHTESSHRFERGVDPDLQTRAIERASELIVAIAGGCCGVICEMRSDAHLPERPPIVLRPARIEKILGISIDRSEVEGILHRLGMSVEAHEQGWEIRAPSFRFDIAIEADLIEEIGRIIGYDNLPLKNPTMQSDLLDVPEARVDLERIKDVLVARGYREAITYSFVDPGLIQLLEPELEPIALKNPISSDLAVMRTSLWCGLLTTAQRNLNRQQTRVRIFESGLKFSRGPSGIVQKKSIAGLLLGSVDEEQWAQKTKAVDFYDTKADVEALLGLSGRSFSFVANRHPALHPGQSAQILAQDQSSMGWLGMLHPELEKQFGFDSRVFLFHLDQELLQTGTMHKFQALSKFPQVRRDLALVVAEAIPAASLVESIYVARRELIKEIKIFDVYRGEGVESGRKSVALGLIFQDSSRTLTDSEIDAIVSKIIVDLRVEFDAKLRE
ncbi:MAG: phenylalanine--tRNA ligase subunit beta [Gammaproteobacteria bacterium]